MARRTDIEFLQDYLKVQPFQRASRRRICEAMNWDAGKLDRVLERAKIDQRHMIRLGKGGVVTYRGSEVSAAKTVGLYAEVQRAIESDWSRKVRAREVQTFQTSHNRSGLAGDWTRPDLVFAAHPLKRPSASSRKLLHAVEIETHNGFSIRSIYQAHAQARGADFAWVFTYASSIETGDQPNRAEWLERIGWAVKKLGVGLVVFGSPTIKASYRVEREARSLEPSTEERSTFIERVLSSSENELV